MKRLKHEAHLLGPKARPAILIECGQIDAGEQDSSGCRRIEAGQ